MAALRHLNLTVSDVDRSIEFYGRWFGFERVLARYPDGTVFITNDDGFELALHAGEPAADRRWHFGFTAETREEVLKLAGALEAAHIELADRHDSDDYVGFKCQDPDGYWIEVYHEPRG